ISPHTLFLSSPVFPRALAEDFASRAMKGALDANPWQEPPENVVRMGFAVMANYLKDLDDFGRTFSNRLKAVLVGLGNAGKTSLAARLEGRGPEHLPSMEERTIGVEIRDVTLGPG
ncbi:unnamed protein product, partial [Hapterophycus canaliculatus]